MSNTPWKPAAPLEYPCPPGYRQRYCVMTPENIKKKESERWFIVKDKQGKSVVDSKKTAIDGKPLDNTVQYRTLILMRITEEDAKARDKYYADLNKAKQTSNARRFEAETAGESAGYPGAGAYGNVTVSTEGRDDGKS